MVGAQNGANAGQRDLVRNHNAETGGAHPGRIHRLFYSSPVGLSGQLQMPSRETGETHASFLVSVLVQSKLTRGGRSTCALE